MKLPTLAKAKEILSEAGYEYIKKDGEKHLVGLPRGGKYLATSEQLKTRAAIITARKSA